MNAAIEAMEREEEEEEEIGYVGVAKRYGINESTLRRRHQGIYLSLLKHLRLCKEPG
jgi:hypothetical protein